MAVSKSAFQLEVENEVRKALLTKPSTINQLSERTGYTYHSVLRAVRSLQEANVVFTSTVGARNQKYRIDPEAKKVAFMPMIASGSQRLPIIGLLDWVGKEDNMAAVGAVKSVPSIVTRLLHYGVRAADKDEVSGDLLRLRVEANNNIKLLKSVVSIYEQMVNNTELWSPSELATITEDSRFDTEEVLTAYEYYFPSKGQEDLSVPD